ncbi:hypothetical protein I553_5257 [Mycobacterium xenopi 4042]|uniref:Uncharacterized protein n=1 Tax=Mycobacterium xenopi 4042 TaxID=1299334 RepID=X7ZV18_MYCXE|nr:hypothetical protein I553_5257 [Mycobacterium xenopi 4042]
MGALLAHAAADSTLEQAALELLPTVRGAFCLIFMDENTLYAGRDPFGYGRCAWDDSTAAGWWLPKPQPSTSSGRRSSVTSSRVNCWRSTPTGAVQPFRRAHAQGLRLRIRLPGTPGQHDRRPIGARRPG